MPRLQHPMGELDTCPEAHLDECPIGWGVRLNAGHTRPADESHIRRSWVVEAIQPETRLVSTPGPPLAGKGSGCVMEGLAVNRSVHSRHGHHDVTDPPLIPIVWPVTHPAPSDASHTHAVATSASRSCPPGSPWRASR